MLRDAIHAWDAGRADEALSKTLDAWRANRSPALGEVVERVSERVVASRGPLPGRNRAEKLAEWRRLGASPDPADVPRLLTALSDLGRAGAEEPVATIADWPRDPRVASALLALLRAPPLGYQGQGSLRFWERVLEAVVAHADERSLAVMDGVAEQYRRDTTTLARWVRRALPQARARVTRGAAPAEDEAAAKELLARLEPTVRSGLDPDELLAEIYAAPEDDDLRRVYADALLERSDPRGEFVLLQLQAAAGSLSRAQRSRMAALEREHGRRWLGRIEGVVLRTGLKFERGFPAVVRCGAEQPAIVKRAVGAPEWATVRDLEIGTLITGNGEAIALHPAMRSLRVLRGAREGVFDAPRELALEELTLHDMSRDALPSAMVTGAAVPRLRVLDVAEASQFVPAEVFRPLWDGLGARLETFVVRGYPSMMPWVLEAPRVSARRLEIRATPHDPWGAVLEGGASGARVLFRCEWPYDMPDACPRLAEHLAQVDARWSRIEVQLHPKNDRPSPAALERLRAAAERLADEVVLP